MRVLNYSDHVGLQNTRKVFRQVVILTLAKNETNSEQTIGAHQLPVVHFTNVDPSFESWMEDEGKSKE